MAGGFSLGFSGVSLKTEGADLTTSVGQTVTSNASAQTKGSYAQIVASTSEDAVGIILCVGPSTNSGRFSVDVAIGGSGSEIIIAADLIANFAGQLSSMIHFFIPISIPSGTRIAARVQCQNASSPTVKVSCMVLDGSFDDLGALSLCTTYGFVAASTKGTTVDPGASANTKGSWVQMAASTTYDISALMVTFDGGGGGGGSNGSFVDIGVGAAAAEKEVITNIPEYQSATINYSPIITQPFRVSIPAGSRLSARAQCSSNTSSQRNSTVQLYGFS